VLLESLFNNRETILKHLEGSYLSKSTQINEKNYKSVSVLDMSFSPDSSLFVVLYSVLSDILN